MREFYVYGFKSRTEFDSKSARSYDDERRRIESWLGDHMGFVRTRDGKNAFISIDSRVSTHNPLYKGLKTKSFTDKDITLHFILFDLLSSPEIKMTLDEILDGLDAYLSAFPSPMLFDESTVRKKLREYISEGIICTEKYGKSNIYFRSVNTQLPKSSEGIHFFSEVMPCGAVGSFLLDKYPDTSDKVSFKHHYITSALDSDVLALLFEAMHRKCSVTAVNYSRHADLPNKIHIVPLRVFISVQTGRQHLLAFDLNHGRIKSWRIDYLAEVEIGDECPSFDNYRALLEKSRQYMWGVNCSKTDKYLETVEFTVFVDDGEEYIVNRLEREKRLGKLERVDDNHYRFSATVFDTGELLPWIRSFVCRITSIKFSNRTLENRFREDLQSMYELYGIGGEGE
ncbi:MAG: WYL domain-containing protein [Clostridia bacterium]|nr:WYL domain-containing protein [Clostridia bacterium]